MGNAKCSVSMMQFILKRKEIEVTMIKRKSHLIIMLLTITFSLLTHTNFIRAEETESINPNFAFDYSILLSGQSTSKSTTATTSFDIFSVVVISVGNSSLTASLDVTSEQPGVWWLALLGTGQTANSSDLVFGLTSGSSASAQIDINPDVGLAIAIGGIVATTPVTEEEPLSYSINVSGR
jgi:hypothetical protein